MSTDATGPVVGSAQFTDVAVGRRMPVYRVQPTIRHAVMYAAAMWEFQRIHYDDRWAREEEGLPGAVVQGPVLGNYLVQSIQHWAGAAAVLRRIEWRNHALVMFGDDIRCEAEITAVEPVPDGDASWRRVSCTLSMRNQADREVVSAVASVDIPMEKKT